MAIQTNQAQFDGMQDHVDITWNDPFVNGYYVTTGTVVDDDGGPVAITITSVSSSGLTVNTSAAFSGHVDIIGFEILT